MKIYKLYAASGKYKNIGLDIRYKYDILETVSRLNNDTKLADWNPPRFFVTKSKFPDAAIPCLIGSSPVFSENAFLSVNSFLSPWGEFIRCETNLSDYFIFHVINSINALDIDKSVMSYFPSTKVIDRISHWAFVTELVSCQVIFKIPQCLNDVFVTEHFDIFLQEAGLKGYRLEFLAEV